ncbi:FAD/NAD-binding domain-containing protein [Phellopilus nigrolimitatus]|nr:FAD/NAD-binding domain-containing protein [Phellopilus nigrolimitatus]
MQSQPRLKIAISGGGIGGLTLAFVLNKYAAGNIDIDIYEAAPQFAEVGAGITVWQRTRNVLQTLGLGDVLTQKAVSPPVNFRKSDSRDGGFEFSRFDVPFGSVALHRAEMLKLLTDQLTPASAPILKTHFSKRLISYEQDPSGTTLRFEDGSSTRADVLVGADGLGSPTRRAMYDNLTQAADAESAKSLQKLAQPTWTGTHAYRALIERARLAALAPDHPALTQGLIWFGKDKHVISYPISATVINILFYVTTPAGLGSTLEGPSVVDASKEEVTEHFKDWEENIRTLADLVTNSSKWAISHVRGLPTYVDGRVALLGDSVRVDVFHLSILIFDAYVLGRLLALPSVTPANIPEVLKIYDTVRRPFANDVVERSLTIGFLYELERNHLPPGIDAAKLEAGEREELKKLVEEAYRIWSVHWERTPEEDWVRAREMADAAGRDS